MKDSQIIEILRTFSKAEMLQFIKFCSSPYYNRGKKLTPFLKELMKFHPAFESAKLTKKYLYEKLYPGRRYNQQVIKNLMSGVMHVAGEYLMSLNIRNDVVASKLRLIEELQSRRLYQIAGKILAGLKKEFNDSLTDSFYFNKMSRIIFAEKEQQRNNNEPEKMIEYTRQLTTSHFLSYFAELAFLLHELKTFEVNMNFKFDNSAVLGLIASSEMQEMVELTKKECSKFAGEIDIYHGMMILIVNSLDEKTFTRTYLLLKENISRFSRYGRHELLIFFLAASTRLEILDKTKYRRITFELMKLMMNTDSFSAVNNLAMNLGAFRNIIIVSLSLKEFDWCEKFLNDHIDKLYPENRENMYNFSCAKLSFARRKFDDTLKYLSKVRYDYFALKYDVKVLTLKVYYELEFYEQAFSLIDTFKHFISENKNVSDRKKDVNRNFLAFSEALLKYKVKGNIINFPKLKNEIECSSALIEKSWLLEKVLELKNEH